jgi:uncharacterized protein (DUF983 family)
MSTQLASNASMTFEASMTRVVLRRCPDCESPHPYALKLNTLECPGCGLERDSGQSETVPAVITGSTPSLRLAKLCLGVGQWLRDLSKRI